MAKATITDRALKESAARGLTAYFEAVATAVNDAVGGSLTAETMAQLNADQITLIAYKILREELTEGGFIQLIHNGYGAFIFVNPFARALQTWGMDALATLIRQAHKLYNKYHAEIERDMSDEEFMALYEQYPAFDKFDDNFVENEEMFTALAACYVDNRLDRFVEVTDE